MPFNRNSITQLPNLITILRIIMAPLMLLMIIFLPQSGLTIRSICTVLFVMIALTDLLDGYLARKQRKISKFGTCFDHIADKALIAFCLLGLMYIGKAGIIPVSIILVREIIVSGIREFIALEFGKNIPVTSLSKTKTVFQIIAISLILFLPTGQLLLFIGEPVLIISAILSLVTLFQHVKIAIKISDQSRV